MSIRECCELLNEFVDESDPNFDEPWIEDLLQTIEYISKDYPNEDWLHLTFRIYTNLQQANSDSLPKMAWLAE